MRWISFLLFLIAAMLSSCSGSKKATNEVEAPLTFEESLQIELADNAAYQNSLFGAIFYDEDGEKIIWENLSDKHFTPASNTKIFTLYASLALLPDSITAYRYRYKGDTLFIQAAGDPSFLHHFTESSFPAFHRLTNHEGPIVIYLGVFDDEKFGSGWSWADYTYYYQAEKSPFPIYGNTMRAQKKPQSAEFHLTPNILADRVKIIRDSTKRAYTRDLESNQWTFNLHQMFRRTWDYDLPFRWADDFKLLIRDTLKRDVLLVEGRPDSLFEETQKSVPRDTVLKWMMHKSDNFYAEQLMLMCANELYDTMSVYRAIKYVRDTLLTGIPDSIKWVDGSGLSRYNLFSPRSIVWLLQKMSNEYTDDDLQYYFPKISFIPELQVYAKTGTLSNNRCLSGYLYTRSNRKILFSIMVNHHLMRTSDVNKDIDDLIRVVERYY